MSNLITCDTDCGGAFIVLENLPTAIIVVDGAGIIIYANKRVYQILYSCPKPFTGKSLEEILIPLPKLIEISRSHTDDDITQRHSVKSNCAEDLTIGFSLSEIHMDPEAVGEENKSYIISLQDIAKIKTLQMERNHLLQLAAIHNSLHSILHEVKNPIAAITVMVELAIEEMESENFKGNLQRIVRHCNRLCQEEKQITDPLISENSSTTFIFSQLHQIRHKLEQMAASYSTVNLEKELKSIFAECNRVNLTLEGISCIGRKLNSKSYNRIHTPLREALEILTAKGQREKISIIDRIEEMPLLPFDTIVLRSIIFNLTMNAIAFCPPGARIEVIANYNHKETIFLLQVKDSGRGMSKEVRERATDLFFTTNDKGSGIGLSLVSTFVKESGGNMLIDSEPGRGTIITIMIPRSV